MRAHMSVYRSCMNIKTIPNISSVNSGHIYNSNASGIGIGIENDVNKLHLHLVLFYLYYLCYNFVFDMRRYGLSKCWVDAIVRTESTSQISVRYAVDDEQGLTDRYCPWPSEFIPQCQQERIDFININGSR